MAKKKVLFYFGHPAQFLFAKHTIKILQEAGIKVTVLIKSKDVLEKLLEAEGIDFLNILPEGRKDTSIGMLFGLIKREISLIRYLLSNRVDLLIGTDPSLAHAGKLLRIPVITTLEDDVDVIPKLAKLTYPFTDYIFTPGVCQVGKKYERKKIPYNGYMKLAYLHPSYFTPDNRYAPANGASYILIRLAKLTAHHDDDIRGLDYSIIDEISRMADGKMKIFINSEYELPKKYEHMRLKVSPQHIHHVLNYCTLFISDSQSMTVEAAMLGTPSIRYSDFAGRISVLEELEYTYNLTTSVKPPNVKLLLDTIEEKVSDPDLNLKYKQRREKMLSDKIDVTQYLTDLILNYPESVRG